MSSAEPHEIKMVYLCLECGFLVNLLGEGHTFECPGRFR